MDLVNLMYIYINRIINSDELLNKIKQIDLSNYSDEEKRVIEQLIYDVKKVKRLYPNEIDYYQKNRLKKVDKMLNIFKQIKDKEIDDAKNVELINNQYKKLQIEKETIRDGGKLYEKVFELLTNNTLIEKYAKQMNDIELLEFITQFISVPLPPEIDQEAFNDLVVVGINEDRREELWRLAFNYNHKNMDFSLIENYFIDKRDVYYLTELISAVGDEVNMDNFINKMINSKDKKFINTLAEECKEMRIIDNETYNKLKS